MFFYNLFLVIGRLIEYKFLYVEQSFYRNVLFHGLIFIDLEEDINTAEFQINFDKRENAYKRNNFFFHSIICCDSILFCCSAP